MKPYYEESGITIYHGDCREVLKSLPDESVNCCVTSPPYWGLRDYGTATWDGGDSECTHSVGGQVQDNKAPGAIMTGQRPGVDASVCRKCGAVRVDSQIGLESTPQLFVAKMVEVFGEVRRVLKPDGTCWLNLGDSYAGYHGNSQKPDSEAPSNKPGYVENMRSTTVGISGLKPKDLCGIPWRVAFALQEAGWWLRSDIIWAKPAPMPESVTDRPTRSHEYIFLLTKREKYYYDSEAIAEPSGGTRPRMSGPDEPKRFGTTPVAATCLSTFGATETRNKRDVWMVNTTSFSEAHFATFPPALILPCILAGCPVGGTVIDPFMGAGTTAMVSKENGRRSIGCELNSDYIEIAANRLSQSVFEF